MEKDYYLWTPLKQALNNDPVQKPFFHARQIWLCHLGENIGYEQDGRGKDFLRPMIIVKKFNSNIFWGIPLTRTLKEAPFYFHFAVMRESGIATSKSSAILSQIKLTDARRLADRIGYISRDDFAELMKKFKALLP